MQTGIANLENSRLLLEMLERTETKSHSAMFRRHRLFVCACVCVCVCFHVCVCVRARACVCVWMCVVFIITVLVFVCHRTSRQQPAVLQRQLAGLQKVGSVINS